MNHHATPCAADDDGRRCTRAAVMLRPVALCDPHRLDVALAVVPDVLRARLADATSPGAVTPPVRHDLTASAAAVPVDRLLDGVHPTVVYFIANGGRVKIGYTTNLRQRLASLTLQHDNVLLALDGGPDLERALHAQFAEHRQSGSEWFELAPAVFRYIADKQLPAATGTQARRRRRRGPADTGERRPTAPRPRAERDAIVAAFVAEHGVDGSRRVLAAALGGAHKSTASRALADWRKRHPEAV